MLEVRDLRCGYGREEIVHGVSFDVERGEFVCVLGPNGCGKSTTLKAVLGLLEPISGSIEMDGASTVSMPEKQRARRLAYIPQSHTPPFPFTVADVVMLGRTPHLNALAVVGDEDRRVAFACMERMGVTALAGRPYTRLSGGQRQLVLIARALAQDPDLLVMDEPTASLDFGNQQLVLRQVRELAGTGMGVLMVTHDPGHALMCASRAVVMEDGRVIADGAPGDVLGEDVLGRIYGAAVRVADVDAGAGTVRVCVPVLE